jgi:tetratricopeptide (TPR) repeat protein
MSSEKIDTKPGLLAQWRAESSWRTAVRALASGDVETARSDFLAAVEYDPTCADSWLGLHHLGVDRDQALAAMERHSDQLGNLRTRANTPLSSSYSLGWYTPTQQLDDQPDVWRAVTARQIETGQLESAAVRLAAAVTADDHVRILRLNLALALSDWSGAIVWGRYIAEPALANFADLHIGRSLIELGAYPEAKRVLQMLIDRSHDDPLRACAADWCAIAFERLHDTENAERWYQFAFRLDPTGQPEVTGHVTAKLRTNPSADIRGVGFDRLPR